MISRQNSAVKYSIVLRSFYSGNRSSNFDRFMNRYLSLLEWVRVGSASKYCQWSLLHFYFVLQRRSAWHISLHFCPFKTCEILHGIILKEKNVLPNCWSVIFIHYKNPTADTSYIQLVRVCNLIRLLFLQICSCTYMAFSEYVCYNVPMSTFLPV